MMSLAALKNTKISLEDNVTDNYVVIPIRLTDSALRDLETLATSDSLTVPLPSKRSVFNLSVSSNSPQADFSTECLYFKKNHVHSLGRILSRLTVDARDDTFSQVKEKMNTDDNRHSHTKHLGDTKKRIKVPVAQKINSAPKEHVNPSSSKESVQSHSLRSRVMHILALRPYQRPELILRLKLDGLFTSQQNQLDDILSEVAKIGSKSAYRLNDSLVAQLDPHWPGYSNDERSRIIDLKSKTKASHRTKPTGPTPTVITSNDPYARRPTRASAPVAPHSFAKKIAALDLLASGVSRSDVAQRLGINHSLLVQWQSSESQLRQRYQRQVSVNTTGREDDQPSADHDSGVKRSAIDHQHQSVVKKRRLVTHSAGGAANPGHYTASNHCDLPSTDAPPSQHHHQEHLTSRQRTDGLSSPISSNNNIPVSSSSQRFLVTDGFGDGHSHHHIVPTGSSGESAAHTPFSSQSCSDHAAVNNPRLVSASFDDESSLDESYWAASKSSGSRFKQPVDDYLVSDFDTGSSTSDLSSSDHFTDLSPQMTEIERLYPDICNNAQVDAYRTEFQSIYPTYVSLYNTLASSWKDIGRLRSRLVAASKESFDSPSTVNWANQLDRAMRDLRSDKRLQNEADLALKAHKLRVIKARLRTFRRQAKSRPPPSNDLRRFAVT